MCIYLTQRWHQLGVPPSHSVVLVIIFVQNLIVGASITVLVQTDQPGEPIEGGTEQVSFHQFIRNQTASRKIHHPS